MIDLADVTVVDPSPLRRAADAAPRVPSPSPCFFCSAKLYGGRGVELRFDGRIVYAHRECLVEAAEDDDYRGRIDLGGDQ